MHLLNQRMCLLGKINNEASYLLSIGFGKLIYKYCLKRDSICYNSQTEEDRQTVKVRLRKTDREV
jgi:hypothetical protein